MASTPGGFSIYVRAILGYLPYVSTDSVYSPYVTTVSVYSLYVTTVSVYSPYVTSLGLFTIHQHSPRLLTIGPRLVQDLLASPIQYSIHPVADRVSSLKVDVGLCVRKLVVWSDTE